MKSADVVIVGGGIIGTACAESLSREGLHVVLLERHELAAGTSGAGMTGAGYGVFMSSYDLHMCAAATTAYQEFADGGADVEFRRPGAMLVSEPGEEAWLQEGLEQVRSVGIAGEWLDQRALRDAEPHLSPVFTGAAFLPDVGMVSPFDTCLLYYLF